MDHREVVIVSLDIGKGFGLQLKQHGREIVIDTLLVIERSSLEFEHAARTHLVIAFLLDVGLGREFGERAKRAARCQRFVLGQIVIRAFLPNLGQRAGIEQRVEASEIGRRILVIDFHLYGGQGRLREGDRGQPDRVRAILVIAFLANTG